MSNKRWSNWWSSQWPEKSYTRKTPESLASAVSNIHLIIMKKAQTHIKYFWLTACVEACLLHGLNSCGFLKANTTLNLVTRLAKQCSEADKVVKMCEEYARMYCETSSNSYYKKTTAKKKSIGCGRSEPVESFGSLVESCDLSQERKLHFAATFYKGSACYKFLWIRLALLNKSLVTIIDSLINNTPSQYYSSNALCADPVGGVILCSLLGNTIVYFWLKGILQHSHSF